MTEHMSAAEYRREFVDTAEEAENPYANELSVILNKQEKQNNVVKREYFSSIVKQSQGLPQPTEHEIQSAILERLGLLGGAFFWRENSGLMQVGEPGKQRFFRAGTPGIPDIMGVYKGRSVGIEVKRPGKKQSIDQLAFMQRFRQCGGVYLVCTDSAMVVDQINQELAKYE